MLTVRELLRGLDVRLVSGEEAIDAPVRWVHISELLDPTTWLSGGEVLLTTGMALETPEQQREFVGRLADHQLAALGFGVGFGHAEVPPALAQAAAERDFPVFAVPYEVPFIAVTEAASPSWSTSSTPSCAGRWPRMSAWSAWSSPSAGSTRSPGRWRP
jgi:purine catabolism regulator